MPRGRPKCEGIKDLPNVPYYPGEMAPMMRDTDFERGVLRDVSREPIYRVMAFSDDSSPAGGGASPARADFVAGRPNLTRTQVETRVMPETQLPGSYNTMSGNGAPLRSWMRARGGAPLIGDGAPPETA